MAAGPFAVAEAAATATPTPLQISAYAAAPETERIRILIQLCRAGNADLAEFFLNRHPLQGPHASNRTLFVSGLIKRARGDLMGAVADFRAALAADPKLSLVRSELAQTLYELDEGDSAIHHLRLLQAEAPDEQAAVQIGSFIDRIDQSKPYQFSAYVAAAPTTNVNSGSIRKTVSSFNGQQLVIDDTSRKQSGLGVAFGGNAGYSHRLGNTLSVVASAGAHGRVYDESRYNSYTLSQSLELRHAIEGGYVSLGAISSQDLDVDNREFGYVSYGPRVAFRKNFGISEDVAASVSYEWRDYAHDANLDGTELSVDASWQHGFDQTFAGTLFGAYHKVEAELEMQSYQSVSAGFSIYKELPNGITVDTSLELMTAKFDEMNPLAGKVRKDFRAIAQFGLTKRDLNFFGFAPSLDYTYTWNDSNISLWDYDSHAVDLRLTKNF